MYSVMFALILLKLSNYLILIASGDNLLRFNSVALSMLIYLIYSYCYVDIHKLFYFQK